MVIFLSHVVLGFQLLAFALRHCILFSHTCFSFVWFFILHHAFYITHCTIFKSHLLFFCIVFFLFFYVPRVIFSFLFWFSMCLMCASFFWLFLCFFFFFCN
jgi:hypothetical protein